MFRRGDNSNFNVQNSFFLPLEYEYTVKDNVPSRKKSSVGFFPLDDSLFTSKNNSGHHKSEQFHRGNAETIRSQFGTDAVPIRIDEKEGKWDRIQDDDSSNLNYQINNSNDPASSGKYSQSIDCNHIAESKFSKKNGNIDSLRSNSATFMLNTADEDVIEFSFDDNVPYAELLSGATLEKCSLTLNEINKKLFNTLYDFRVSKDNPEENLVELILPNCVVLLNFFEDIELLADSSDEAFEKSTFINTIEFIVHDIWVETLIKNINLLQMFDADLKCYNDKYIICKLKGQYPSTNIVDIMCRLKHFSNSILETFKFGIELKEQDQCHNRNTIINYVLFSRVFSTIVLEIQKCFILIVKFMYSVNFLEKFSDEVFLSFIEILIKIVFEHQIPQLFLGIDEIIQLWLKNNEVKRQQLLSAWCNGTVQDMKQSQQRESSNAESESIASSTEEDEEGLQFNKWDVIEPFIDNIKALNQSKSHM
ncbi:BAP_1a_G0038090.mRNA.1.CDS.1 [Saccharomyces cerevisiae]|nr:BAP_1a_G0038090.mRNA.1.CDS.1 [Saccharomyces cerevisiae]CAI7246714.1 BAP_1a_G0038090.mRNA.1.CDS.1 [Saccharomyces cerevisiae]